MAANASNTVTTGYAEIRADTTKLPGDIGKVPGILRSLLSLNALKNVGKLITGNFTGFVNSTVVAGYTRAADRLKAVADHEDKTAQKLNERAKEAAARGRDKNNPMADADKAHAEDLKRMAKEAKARADSARSHAAAITEAGNAAGSAAVGAIRLAAAAGVAAIAVLVKTANSASTNLKTAQLVRATGTAAGWTTEKLDHMRESLRKASQYSNAEIAGAQQALLMRPNIQGDEYKRALISAANLASVLGKDLPEAAAELGDILQNQDPVTATLLSKYGILLNKTQVGWLNAKIAAHDYAGYQNAILDHLERFKGASKEASETGVGGWNKLVASINNAIDKIFGVTGGMGALAAKFADWIDGMVDKWDVFKLNFSIGWETIKIGFRTGLDAIVTGVQALYVTFGAVFDAIGAGAEALWDNIINTFTDEPYKDIADEMANAFRDAMVAGGKRFKIGEDSDAVKQMRRERADMIRERDRIEGKKKAIAAGGENPLDKKGEQGPKVSLKPFKFEFSGFEQLHKNIQGALFPNEQLQLQKAAVAAAEKLVGIGGEEVGILGQILAAAKAGVGAKFGP